MKITSLLVNETDLIAYKYKGDNLTWKTRVITDSPKIRREVDIFDNGVQIATSEYFRIQALNKSEGRG